MNNVFIVLSQGAAATYSILKVSMMPLPELQKGSKDRTRLLVGGKEECVM